MNRKMLPIKVGFMIVRLMSESHFSEMIEFKLKSNLDKGTLLSGSTPEPQELSFWGDLIDEFKNIKNLWKDRLEMDLSISKEMDQFKIEIKAK